MRYLLQLFRNFFKKGDIILLLMCLLANAFGCLVIASTTNTMDSLRNVVMQILASGIGVITYMLMTSVDMEFFSEHRRAIFLINAFLLLLLIPFGTDMGSGNKSWLDFPILPFNIQPAEICKIGFVLIMASVMASHQNRISHVKSVMHMAFHLIFLFGLNMVLSGDLGVSLIYIFTFVGMAFAGGVNLFWFLLAIGGIVAVWPFVWPRLGTYQQNRLLILIDPTIDPYGIDERYHTVRSLKSLTGGGFSGQGLFNGTRTQTPDALAAQHTDFIFAAIGEELGFVGCVAVLAMLFVIVARCIYVGSKSTDYMRRLVCFGAASVLIFQIVVNVGMCIGVMPVIGLTLPFISYGSSSIVSLYTMLGLVSSVHARPTSASHERYIRAY